MSSSNVAMAQKKSGSKQPSSKDFDSGLPEFACKCANEALDRGNAVFGIQNLGKSVIQYSYNTDTRQTIFFDSNDFFRVISKRLSMLNVEFA